MAITENSIECDDLNAKLAEYQALGWRLDMIFPADNPREALMSKQPVAAGGSGDDVIAHQVLKIRRTVPPADAGGSDGSAGRAGMMYRDLIPGRIGGKVIASHIKLLEDGPVADYVHYHKVEFQMIYCLKGRIEVVYEDQGLPFWLEAGDCVVQPPEIRHRVLFAEGGAEVLEVTMPAEHETWADHEMTLPNDKIDKGRRFNGQLFVITTRP